MKNYDACMSTSRPGVPHSKKNCVCGGHSARDHKKNLNHDGTKRRIQHRQGRLAQAWTEGWLAKEARPGWGENPYGEKEEGK